MRVLRPIILMCTRKMLEFHGEGYSGSAYFHVYVLTQRYTVEIRFRFRSDLNSTLNARGVQCARTIGREFISCADDDDDWIQLPRHSDQFSFRTTSSFLLLKFSITHCAVLKKCYPKKGKQHWGYFGAAIQRHHGPRPFRYGPKCLGAALGWQQAWLALRQLINEPVLI